MRIKLLILFLLMLSIISGNYYYRNDIVDKSITILKQGNGTYHPVEKQDVRLTDRSLIVNSINPDSLSWFVQKLEDFGTRFCYAENRFEVSEWIASQFIRMGFTNVQLDPFVSSAAGLGDVSQKNVIAILEGSTYPDEYIIIGAHHDSFSTSYPHSMTMAPGADDNASGTAAVLEIARVFMYHEIQPLYSIRFMTYAMEELWMHGSYHDAAKVLEEGLTVKAMFNLDMIANQPDDLDWIFKIIRYPNGDFLLDRALERASEMNMQIYSTYEGMHLSDGIPYYEIGIPVIYFFEYYFSENYHKDGDTLANLNLPYFLQFTRLIGSVLLDISDTVFTNIQETDLKPVLNNLNLKNYPNPFNPLTTIQFTLSSPDIVELSIYNIKGEMIKNYPPEMYQSGTHSFQWEADGVASGLYFYQIKTESGRHEVNKMVLLK